MPSHYLVKYFFLLPPSFVGTHTLVHLKLSRSLLVLCSFFKHSLFSECSVLNSFYRQAFKLTELLFCDTCSALVPVRCVSHPTRSSLLQQLTQVFVFSLTSHVLFNLLHMWNVGMTTVCCPCLKFQHLCYGPVSTGVSPSITLYFLPFGHAS